MNLVQHHGGEVENVSANQRPGGHLVPLIDPKIINLLVDVEILRPVKFYWIPFTGFRGEVENALANQRPGWLSCSSDRPEKHKRGRRRWDLASCEFCWIPSCFSNRPEKNTSFGGGTFRSCFLSSFVEFQLAVTEEKSKMSQSIRGQGGHLVFPIGPKTTNLVEDVEIFLPFKIRWIPFSGFRGEVENVAVSQRPGR